MLQDVAILLPCHSLEDFSVDWSRREASDLLSAWTLSWHPEFLAGTGRLATWHSAAAPPELMPETAILIPPASADQLPAGWLDRIAADSLDAIVVREFAPRPWDLSDVLPDGATIGSETPSPTTPMDQEIIRDFFALGFCYFMVELQSRQMRYSSNLDTLQLQEFAVGAAKSAVAGKFDDAQEKIQSAFDTLASARDYYYPADSFLVDVTLVAPSLFGQPLRDRLRGPTPTNVVINGALLEQMAAQEPDSLAALRKAVDRGTACIVGGEYDAIDWRLATPSACERELARGRAVYEKLLGCVPTIYGRHRFQTAPRLPQLLNHFGFRGVLVAAFDGRQLPKSQQSKTRWGGAGDVRIDALWRVPADNADPESIIRFAHEAAEAMDHDFVATSLYAGWPGAACPWYDDFRLAAARGMALGKFVTLDEYFESTAYADAVMRPSTNAGNEVPLILGAAADDSAVDPISSCVAAREVLAAAETKQRRSAVAMAMPHDERGNELIVNLQDRPRAVHFASADKRNQINTPAARSRRGAVPQLWGPPPDQYVADVPGVGFTRHEPIHSTSPTDQPAPLAEGTHLQNEFIQVELDAVTGAIRGMGEYTRRGQSVAQQIAFCTPGEDPKHTPPGNEAYSVMAADSVRVTTSNGVCGEIEVNGRLLLRNGETVAEFCQTTRILRATRFVLLDVEIKPRRLPEPNRLHSYYALRFAWPGGEAFVCDSSSRTRDASGGAWIIAGDWVDIRQPAGAWTLFPMGLPLHRRVGETVLDTLLITHGETRRRFRCAMGVGCDARTIDDASAALHDMPQPLNHAAIVQKSCDSAWLFHVDAPNVRMAELTPLDGGRKGVAVGLMEMCGQKTVTHFRTPHPTAQATKRSPGNSLGGEELPCMDGVVPLTFGPYEWLWVEVEWV